MPRDWQRIVFDNRPIYVNADAKGNQPSMLKMLKKLPAPFTSYKDSKMITANAADFWKKDK